MNHITPNDSAVQGSTDVERIQNAIRLAKETGINSVLIPRKNLKGEERWTIDNTILLPSDITIYLDNCVLWTPKEVCCNIFRNENYGTQLGKTMAGEQHYINIIGLGTALLDGGEYNEISESTAGKNGLPRIYNNCMILMSNVCHVQIKNLKIRHQRWWAICFAYSRKVHVCDIHFHADFAYRDANGNRCTDRTARKEYECYVKNADGIDLRNGCHDFVIENISGRTEDDSVALTTLQGKWYKEDYVEGKDNDIHNVIINKIHTDCLETANIRLTCADGNKIYNIDISSVIDTSPEDAIYSSGGNIKINDSYYHKIRISEPGEMYNIRIDGVYAKGVYAVVFKQQASNVSIKNVYQNNPKGYAVAHTQGDGFLWGNVGPFVYNNISIENVFYSQPPLVDYGIKFANCELNNFNVGFVGEEVKTFIGSKPEEIKTKPANK